MAIPRSILASIALTLVAVAPASGQGASLAHPPWRRVQQGFDDAEPLARSMAIPRHDLRAPIGFEDVYDLGDGRLARIDGGLIAVFPRSTYERRGEGLTPTIPPGTVFYLGMPPPAAPAFGRGPDRAFDGGSDPASLGRGPMRRAGLGLGHPVGPASTRAGPAPRLDGDRPQRPAATMFNSEAERRRVVGELLRRAHESHRP